MNNTPDSVRSYFTGLVDAHNTLQIAGVEAYNAVTKEAQNFVGKQVLKKDGTYAKRFKNTMRGVLENVKSGYDVNYIVLTESYGSEIRIELKSSFTFTRRDGKQAHDSLTMFMYIDGFVVNRRTQRLELNTGEVHPFKANLIDDTESVIKAFEEIRETALRLHSEMEEVQKKMPQCFRYSLCYSLELKPPRDLQRLGVV